MLQYWFRISLTMTEEENNLENHRLEYSEANTNHRHYSNLRFAILSVFFAVLGGVVSVSFGIVEIKSPSSINIARWARFAGLFFTIVFLWIEYICEHNLRHFAGIAKQLETSLGCRQFTTRKFRFVPRVPYLTYGMYLLIIAFWIYAIIRA